MMHFAPFPPPKKAYASESQSEGEPPHIKSVNNPHKNHPLTSSTAVGWAHSLGASSLATSFATSFADTYQPLSHSPKSVSAL